MKNYYEDAYFGSSKMLSVAQFDSYYTRVREYVEPFDGDEQLSSLVFRFLSGHTVFVNTMKLFAGGTPAQKADKQFISCVSDWRSVRHIITAMLLSSDSSVKSAGELAYDAYQLIAKKDNVLHTTIISQVSLFEKTLKSELDALIYTSSGLELAVKTLIANVQTFSKLAKAATDYKADINRVTLTTAKENLLQLYSDLVMGLSTFYTLGGDADYGTLLEQLTQLKTEYYTVLKQQQTMAKKAQEKEASSNDSTPDAVTSADKKACPAVEMAAELALESFQWQNKLQEMEKRLEELCKEYHIGDEEAADEQVGDSDGIENKPIEKEEIKS